MIKIKTKQLDGCIDVIIKLQPHVDGCGLVIKGFSLTGFASDLLVELNAIKVFFSDKNQSVFLEFSSDGLKIDSKNFEGDIIFSR